MAQWTFLVDGLVWLLVAMVLILGVGLIALVAVVIVKMIISAWKSGSEVDAHDHHDH